MRLILDIETNGFLMEATKVWCVVLKDIDSGEIYKFTDIQKAVKFLSKATKIIAHNGVMFDLPVLKRLYNYDYSEVEVVDTLIISRLLNPDRLGGHSLKALGEKLGNYKSNFSDFSKYSEEMLEYCTQDVEVTHSVYKYLLSEAADYMPAIKTAVKLEHDFAHIISEQILAGFKLNVDKASELYEELKKEYDHLYSSLQTKMGKVKDLTFLNKVEKENLLEVADDYFIYIQPKTRKVVKKEIKFEESNPTSRQQIIKYLKDKYNWIPTVFTEKNTPKIDEKVLGTLKYPDAIDIARLFRLQKQMGMIKNDDGGWLNYVNKDTGRVHGNVMTNATNTGRCAHSQPNVAQVDKKDSRMREVWEASDGYNLLGCDLASLELRVLAHYLSPYDSGSFAFEVTKGDVHTHNQNLMGLRERNSAKTAIYALVYGAGSAKLGKIFSSDQGDHTTDENVLRMLGSKLRSTIEDNFVGYKQLVTNVQNAYKARGYLVGIDGRPLHPRSDYSALNLLIQSAGAIICKKALTNFWEAAKLKYIHGKDFILVANVHDEVQMEVLPGLEKEIGDLFISSIKKTAVDFNLKCEMDGEVKVGKNWHDTH